VVISSIVFLFLVECFLPGSKGSLLHSMYINYSRIVQYYFTNSSQMYTKYTIIYIDARSIGRQRITAVGSTALSLPSVMMGG
jgi:hypothetical protein